MLLSLRKTESAAAAEPVLALARELGYRTRFLDSAWRVLELVRADGGPGAPGDRSRFEDLGLVRAVLDSADAPELVDHGADRSDTVLRVGDAIFGGGHVSLIAGPCAVEDEDDLLTIARAVRDAGVTLLRGGAFKPRTSPHAFQGLGAEGLRRLARVRDAVGLSLVTEVLDPRDVPLVAGVADMLQIGSRSMSNAALLREAGESGRPVLLKRGLAATVREFLLAAETVLATGNTEILLCERGIRSFDTVTRNLLDVGAIAHLAAATHLPVLCDPSHAAGRPDLVGPLAKAGLVAGADGVIVEVHPRPEIVHSDGAQAISPAAFAELARQLRALARVEGKSLAEPDPKNEPRNDARTVREVEETAP